MGAAHQPKVDSSFALSEVVLAIKLGERGLARSLLATLLRQDPRHEQGLLWYAALAESTAEGIRILERLLSLYPNNQQAQATLNTLRLSKATAGGTSQQTPPDSEANVQAEAAGAGHAHVNRAVVCSLCHWQDTGSPKRCAKCGAVYDIHDLRALTESHMSNEQLLLAGVQRWEQSERHTRSVEGQLNLARAYLNLHRSNDAMEHIRKAVEMRPHEHKLRRTLEQLRARKLVLVVDDSVTIRRIVSIILERQGYRVVLACDGEEALVRIQEESPDLILLDVQMPGLNGYQVCRAIRQDDRYTRTPIVILSASLLDRIKGRLAGVTDYMSKPFEPEQLIRSIQRQLAILR